LLVTEGTGAGEMYKIRYNSAADASNLVSVTLYDALQTAWSISDTDVDLYANPYNGIIVNPVDAQQRPTVLTPRPVTAANYYWAQVRGLASLKIDIAAAAAGLEFDEKVIVPSVNHAGQGYVQAAPASQTANVWGTYIVGYVGKEADIADDTYTLIDLRLM
jgi:hypothetical protein